MQVISCFYQPFLLHEKIILPPLPDVNQKIYDIIELEEIRDDLVGFVECCFGHKRMCLRMETHTSCVYLEFVAILYNSVKLVL